MQCPECSAEVPSQREFCPKCGTPIRRSLRERFGGGQGERTDEELKRNRKTVLILGAALLLSAGVLGKLNWFDPDIDIDAPDRPRGPAVVQAQQLFQAYRDDEDAAEEEYGGREMVVTGKFLRIAPDGAGQPDLRLETSDPAAPLGVDLIQASHAQAPQLRTGEIVTVSCAHVDRTGDERWLRNCAIQEVKAEGAPAASPAPAPTAPDPSDAPVPPER